MENQNNHNLSELDQLKAQYETLKEQFDQQEIVNDQLMKSSIRHSTDFYKRYRWTQFILYPLAAIIGILFIKCFQGNNLSLSLFWLSYCAVCFALELWITRNIHTKSSENSDLLTLSNHARTYKKHFSLLVDRKPDKQENGPQQEAKVVPFRYDCRVCRFRYLGLSHCGQIHQNTS